MDLGITYRGRVATTEDVAFIKGLMAEHPNDSRYSLSRRLCRAWNWVQQNGALKEMVCRGFLLQLHRAGHIQLPAKRCTPNNPLVHRKRPPRVEVDQTPISRKLGEILPIKFCQVRRTPMEKLFNSLVEQHHYLGYIHPVGEHLKYIVFADSRPVACLAWSSAPRHIGCRDRFIGWSQKDRQQRLHLIAYNLRYVLLPWVTAPHLASHVLGKMARILSSDWESVFHHPLYFIETFIDETRFTGTCYRAANWVYLGKTTGRGKNDQTNKPNRSLKAVYGLPLHRNFRRYLCGGQS